MKVSIDLDDKAESFHCVLTELVLCSNSVPEGNLALFELPDVTGDTLLIQHEHSPLFFKLFQDLWKKPWQ